MTDALMPNDKPWWFPKRAPGGNDTETGRPYTYTHDNLRDALDQLDELSDAYLALRAAPQPGKAEGEGWVKVSERMPEVGRIVTVYRPQAFGDEDIMQCEWDGRAWRIHIDGRSLAFAIPTHWRALPAQPVEPGRGGEAG